MTTLDKLLSVSNAELDSIDMSFYKTKYSFLDNGIYFPSAGINEYYDLPSGKEHYRLLSYASSLIEYQTIIDLGTLAGRSSLALGTNKKNKVVSFDIVPRECVKMIDEPHITYRIENILDDGKNNDLIMSSSLIFVDTYHDGTFERLFMERLKSLNYRGLVMFDDIHEFEPMRSFWDSISLPKHDLTSVGHYTGTGIVVF